MTEKKRRRKVPVLDVDAPTAAERRDMMLEVKRIHFANEWLKNGQNQAHAYKAAFNCPDMKDGVASACATRLLKVAKIRQYINQKIKDMQDNAQVDLSWTLKKRIEIVDQAMKAVPVMEWDHQEKKMVESGEFTFDSGGANRALEAIEKNYLGIVDKSEVVHSGISAVSDEDRKLLENFAAKRAALKKEKVDNNDAG